MTGKWLNRLVVASHLALIAGALITLAVFIYLMKEG